MKNIRRLFVAILVLATCVGVWSQATPRTLDAVEEVSPDGTTSLDIRMSFDAAPWSMWKAMVGDQPARLRASFQHQFAAYVLEDFKLEKDDMNRTAHISMRSPSGPEIRKDGSFLIPIEKEFRLVNNTGREWFFSGINPYAGNSLNTIKLILPANLEQASLVNAGTSEQALIYSLAVQSGPSRTCVLLGSVILGIGVVILGIGLFLGRARTGSTPMSGPTVGSAT